MDVIVDRHLRRRRAGNRAGTAMAALLFAASLSTGAQASPVGGGTGCGPAGAQPSGAFGSSGAIAIESVPAYQWYHGCGPTSAASVLAYWDFVGYENLFDAIGSDLLLTVNVRDQISSPAHNLKYDPTPDSAGPVPAFISIADWFGTSVDPLGFGWSWVSYANDAFVGYAGYRGYEFEASTRFLGDDSSPFLFNWQDVVQEIDAGRPLMFTVDTDGNGATDHFVPVLGYDDRGNEGRYYGLYTSWSEPETIVWQPFVGAGNPWGVVFATFVRPVGGLVDDDPDAEQVSAPGSMLLMGLGLVSLFAVRLVPRRNRMLTHK